MTLSIVTGAPGWLGTRLVMSLIKCVTDVPALGPTQRTTRCLVLPDADATYERELRRAREMAIEEMMAAAAEKGANAVVGVDLDYETVGGNASMLMVTVSGTAPVRANVSVTVEPIVR